MKIIDLYILKKFLGAFIYTVLILVLVLCVIDYTEKNDDFIKYNISFGRVIMEYYVNFMPYIANMLSPITVFIATVFVTAKMAAHTEIIAILNSGISFRRMLLPYVIGSSIIGVFTFVLIGWILPHANKERIAFENQFVKNPFYYEGRNIHMKISADTYMYMESYNAQADIGYQFSLEHIEGTQLKGKVKASKIIWVEDRQAWQLENYSIRRFDGENETLRFGHLMDTVINLYPKDFDTDLMLHETLTLPELEQHIRDLKEKGAEDISVFQTEKYERYTYPFAIVILTLIGVVVSARKTREGAGFQIAFGFLLAFVYIIFVVMSRSIAGTGSVGPALAAWMPNLIFGSIGLILYKTVPK